MQNKIKTSVLSQAESFHEQIGNNACDARRIAWQWITNCVMRLDVSKLNAPPLATDRRRSRFNNSFIFQMAVPVVLISSFVANVIESRSSQDATFPKQPPPQHD